jgi:hypothetical protein
MKNADKQKTLRLKNYFLLSSVTQFHLKGLDHQKDMAFVDMYD